MLATFHVKFFVSEKCGDSIRLPHFLKTPLTITNLHHNVSTAFSGVSGGTKYNCPSCEKIKSQDMCFANEKCDGIFTPLHFGRKKIA